MKEKSLLRTIGKVVGLTFGFLICFIVPTMIIPVSPELQQAMQQSGATGAAMVFLLGFSFAGASVASYPVRHARMGGARLMGAMVVTLFGFLTAMGQIETFYFGSAFPLLGTQEILNIVYRGFLTVLLFVPLVVIAWGRMRAEPAVATGIDWGSWLWKAPLLAVVYMLLYFTFGYYVAWQFPETRLLYTGSTELLGVVEHFRRSFAESPFFAPLQFIRGLLWVGFSAPMIVVLAGRRRETIVSLALLGGLFGLQPLLPSPFFPEMVRYAHALEVVPSMVIFGALMGIVLAPKG
jgi:hypothetical protein